MSDAFPSLTATTSSTTGTGVLVLDTADRTDYLRTPKRAVTDGDLTDGDFVFYNVVDKSVTDGDAIFEVGYGAYDDTANTIARIAGNVISGSNGPGVLVSLPESGTRDVLILDLVPHESSQIAISNVLRIGVNGLVLNDDLTINSQASPSFPILMNANTGSAQFYLNEDGVGNLSLTLEDTSGVVKAHLSGSGTLGLGVVPATNLHVQEVNNSTLPAIEIEQLGIGDAALQFSIVGDAYVIGIDNTDGDKLKISYASGAGTAVLGTNDRFVIDSSGNVGIGVASPSAKLEVIGNSGVSISGALIVNTSGNDNDCNVEGTTDSNLFHIDAGDDLVAVGTNTPSAKLHVDQNSPTGTIPVLYLDQADSSEEMIEFNSVIGIGNAIEAVGAKVLTNTHFIKVTLTGGIVRYIPVGEIA